MHEPAPIPPDPESERRGHELRDVAIKPILYFLIGLFLFGGALQGVMSFIMNGYVAQDTKRAALPVENLRDTGIIGDNIHPSPPPALQRRYHGGHAADVRGRCPRFEPKSAGDRPSDQENRRVDRQGHERARQERAAASRHGRIEDRPGPALSQTIPTIHGDTLIDWDSELGMPMTRSNFQTDSRKIRPDWSGDRVASDVLPGFALLGGRDRRRRPVRRIRPARRCLEGSRVRPEP